MKKKQNTVDESITKDFLSEQFDKFGEKIDGRLKTFEERIIIQISVIVEKAKIENDDKAQLYRDQILTRMDKDARNYEQVKEDQVFMGRDIKDLKERIAVLEPLKQAA